MKFFTIDESDYPWHLLLDADPSPKRVDDYLKHGECIGAFEGDTLIGVFVVVENESNSADLMNICVAPEMRDRGYGKKLIAECIRRLHKKGIRRLDVGTGNSSIGQLAFYQKCGFRIISVDRDFFVRNYDNPLHENGIPCRDMIRLSLELDEVE